MKLTVTEDLSIQLEEVFSGLTLKTTSNETMGICMRDSGFEFNYQGNWYSAQDGVITKINSEIHLIGDSYQKTNNEKL